MEVLKSMENEPSLPQVVAESYPVLLGENIKYIGRFAAKVPIVPDCTYDIYEDINSGRILTHVTIDYPDPVQDSEVLRSITAEEYTFRDLILPESVNDTIGIVNNDDFREQFFVKDGDVYHYVANTEGNLVE